MESEFKKVLVKNQQKSYKVFQQIEHSAFKGSELNVEACTSIELITTLFRNYLHQVRSKSATSELDSSITFN